jgi:hypothetical protein
VFYLSAEGSSTQRTELVRKGGASTDMVMMVTKRVSVGKRLCQDSRS